MDYFAQNIKSKKILLYVLFFIGFIANIKSVNAATFSNSSVTLSNSLISQTSSYKITVSNVTNGTSIACIKLDFSTSPSTVSAITGLDLSNASVVAADSNIFGDHAGWSSSTTSTTIKYTKSSAIAPASASSRTLTFDNIVNGSVVNTNYFLTINTYVLTDCTGTPVDTGIVLFRYTEGVSLTAVVDPTLTFSVAGVVVPTLPDTALVNGAIINVASTATSIPFARIVTPSVNAIAAHDITVTTNAASGFTVYVRYTDALKSGNVAIKNHTGTNEAPTSFPTAGSIAPTGGDGGGALGYTTSDDSLSVGQDILADRFTSNNGNKWAGLSTNNQEVIYHSVPATTASVTKRVGYQLGIHSTTPAGIYSTTIIYTITPEY